MQVDGRLAKKVFHAWGAIHSNLKLMVSILFYYICSTCHACVLVVCHPNPMCCNPVTLHDKKHGWWSHYSTCIVSYLNMKRFKY